jgi:hypothetical protein
MGKTAVQTGSANSIDFSFLIFHSNHQMINKVSFGSMLQSTSFQTSSLFFACLNQRHNPVELQFADLKERTFSVEYW